jgi:hypothetical protein
MLYSLKDTEYQSPCCVYKYNDVLWFHLSLPVLLLMASATSTVLRVHTIFQITSCCPQKLRASMSCFHQKVASPSFGILEI